MEPNTRDTLLRRCSTAIWGSALFLAAAIVGILLFPLFQKETPDLVDQEQAFSGVRGVIQEMHEDQTKVYESYNYDAEAAAEALLKKVKK